MKAMLTFFKEAGDRIEIIRFVDSELISAGVSDWTFKFKEGRDTLNLRIVPVSRTMLIQIKEDKNCQEAILSVLNAEGFKYKQEDD